MDFTFIVQVSCCCCLFVYFCFFFCRTRIPISCYPMLHLRLLTCAQHRRCSDGMTCDGMAGCMYVCMYVCMAGWLVVCMCMCMYVCMYVCIDGWMAGPDGLELDLQQICTRERSTVDWNFVRVVGFSFTAFYYFSFYFIFFWFDSIWFVLQHLPYITPSPASHPHPDQLPYHRWCTPSYTRSAEEDASPASTLTLTEYHNNHTHQLPYHPHSPTATPIINTPPVTHALPRRTLTWVWTWWTRRNFACPSRPMRRWIKWTRDRDGDTCRHI